jgi:multidrug efflux system membrane fusion protein
MRLHAAARVFLLSTVLACVSLGCRRVPPAAEEETAPPAPVKVVQAKREPLGAWVEFPGTTQPPPGRAARVTAAVEGRVADLLPPDKDGAVAEGDNVAAGRVIARLDDRIARANLSKAEAAQKDLEAQAKQAALAVELARVELQRLRNLQPDRGAAGGQGLELVAQVTLRKAQLALDDAEAKQQAAEAKRASGDAERHGLATQLDLYTLRAPIAGRLGLLQVAAGQTLAVGAPVAEVVDLAQVDVLCHVPPSQVFQVAEGQPARIAGDGSAPHEETPAEGKVVFVAAQAHPENGCFPLKARFPNPRRRWPANAVVHLRVGTEPEKERLVLPDAVLLPDREPPEVVVVVDVQTKEKEGQAEKVGTARRLQAEVGVRDRESQRVEILRLVDPEKKAPVPAPAEALFVVEGAHGLESGDAVKVEEPKADKED